MKKSMNSKHSKQNKKQLIISQAKYILIIIALLVSVVMLLFGESKLIFNSQELVQVKFNKLYYKNVDTEEYFLTLDEAIESACSVQAIGGEDTIQVINSTTETEQIVIPAGKRINLDLNGKTITLDDGVSITNNGTLGITDTSEDGNGEIEQEDSATTAIVNNGTATITEGIISAEYIAIENATNAELTLGSYNVQDLQNEETSITEPQIIGGVYGIVNHSQNNGNEEVSGTFNFYDGLVRGKNGATSAIDGEVTNVPQDYGIQKVTVQNQDTSDYEETAILVIANYGEYDDEDKLVSNYATLKDALQYGTDNNTIKVEKTHTDGSTEEPRLPLEKTMTLDLDDKTLTLSQRLIIDGTLTIIGEETGTLTQNFSDKAVLMNSGNLDFTSGKILSPNSIGIQNAKAGRLLISGGNIKAGSYAISNSATSTDDNYPGIKISGGTIISEGNAGIYSNATGKIIVQNTTITAKSNAIRCRSTETVIINSGTTLKSTTANGVAHNKGNIIFNDGFINAEADGIFKESSGTVQIKGGTIKGLQHSVLINAGETTIGTDDSTVNTNSPILYGPVSGEGTLNFYDGLVKSTGDLVTTPVTGKPEGYRIITGADVVEDTTTYHTAYLDNHYTVTFDGNGATPSEANMTVTYGDTYGNLATATKVGYTLAGWNGKNLFDEETILMSIEGTSYQDGYYVINPYEAYVKYGYNPNRNEYVGNSEINVDFKENTQYTVKVKGYKGGGTNLYIIFKYTDNTWDQIALPSSEKEVSLSSSNGKTVDKIAFAHGNAGDIVYIKYIQLEEGSTSTAYEPYLVTSTTPVSQDKDHTLTAIWTPNTYTVTADADGGTIPATTGWTIVSGSTSATKSVTYDATYGDLPTPTKAGNTFIGWNGKNKFTGLVKGIRVGANNGLESADSESATSDFIAGDFENNTYCVSGLTKNLKSYVAFYNANKEYMGRTAAGSVTSFTLEGSSSINSSTVTGVQGDVSYIRIRVYAEEGATTDTIDAVDNLEIQLEQSSTPTRYEPYLVVSDTQVTIAGDCTLKAIWEQDEYTVQFDKNAADATGTMENQTMNYDIATNLSANTFTRSNYAFAGWNTEADGSGTSYTDGESVTNIASTSVRSVVLYAQWTYNATPSITLSDYNTFTYTANAGAAYYVSITQTTAPAAGTTAAQNTFALDTWTTATNTGDLTVEAGKTYYVWVKNAITGGNVSENNATIDVRTITRSVGTGTSLTAKYTNSSGTDIIFSNDKANVLNGTVVYMSAGVNIGYESAVLKIDGTNVTNSTTYIISADTTFMTSATEKTAILTYNANGHGTAPANVTMKYSEATNAAAALTATGCVFKGWNTVADGSGTAYAAGQVVKAANTLPSAMTLYAQWEVAPTKYAVQIYGINQDVDASGNTLGLTFGPAVGANYNNSYVTHEYEVTDETKNNADEDKIYYVKIVTHTVAANGRETTSSAYLTDSGSNNVTRSQAQVDARENISLHDMTWAEIKAVQDKTVFEDCMLCGDTKSVSLTLNSTLASGSGYAQYGDGAGVLYDTISNNSYYYMRWNPSTEQNAVATNGGSSGSNASNAGGYSTSHIRATLIGKNTKTDVTYAGDVNLSSDTCLYSCIESDLRSVITPKKIKYVTGTSTINYSLNDDIADSIWLFSEREMYGTGRYSGSITEGLDSSRVTNDTGVGYDKFGNTESKYYISSYNTSSQTNRVAYTEDGSTVSWWLRSPYLDSTSYARHVYFTGGFGGNEAYYGRSGLAFGFCIQ